MNPSTPRWHRRDAHRSRPRGGEAALADRLASLSRRETWLAYALQQFAAGQTAGEERGLPVHRWPDDRHLEHTDGAVPEWLPAWRDRQSPAPSPERDLPDEPMPSLPDRLRRWVTRDVLRSVGRFSCCGRLSPVGMPNRHMCALNCEPTPLLNSPRYPGK